MVIVRRKIDLANPPSLSEGERARIVALTPAEIERNAESDADDPPWTDEELDRAAFARAVRQARDTSGLSQPAFAERFHIGLGRLRDWEQGRVRPDSVVLAYLRVIEDAPDAVARTISRPMRRQAAG